MDKEVLIPHGIYKVGRDMPDGSYLITELWGWGLVSVESELEKGKCKRFLLNKKRSLSCQIELVKGDVVKFVGRIKIKRITKFSCETKATAPKNTSIDNTTTKKKWDKNLSNFYGGYNNNRLQRGLEYFRQGRVENLFYEKGVAKAFVKGSGKESYEVSVFLNKANEAEDRLPTKEQISFECNCPDKANPCKHIVAVLYAISSDSEKNSYVLDLLHDKSI